MIVNEERFNYENEFKVVYNDAEYVISEYEKLQHEKTRVEVNYDLLAYQLRNEVLRIRFKNMEINEDDEFDKMREQINF